MACWRTKGLGRRALGFTAPRPLVPCSDCGRSFKASSAFVGSALGFLSGLEKHKTICKKVFQQKRKQFNSRSLQRDLKEISKRSQRGAASRLGEFDNAHELIARATKGEKREKENQKSKDIETSLKFYAIPSRCSSNSESFLIFLDTKLKGHQICAQVESTAWHRGS